MTVITDEQKISSLLSLGVSEVIVKEDLKKKLLSGKVLRVKLGIDPTGFDLHLGHMVVVHKLREFQDLGHQIILLFGNFTGQIGDPSGKSETRPMRTQEELENNAKKYLEQVAPILDVSKIEVRWNAEWLAPLNFSDVIQLASQFTVSQMLERDMFQDRIKEGKPISVHEFMYPLMQGYDSVALKADVELGGTDQTFNLLAGRTLQKAYGQIPQDILTVPLLIGTDGSMKMGKTTGNYIAVKDPAAEMYGKIMSIPDPLILSYFELVARCSKEEWLAYKQRLEGGENPRDLKMELAKKIVEMYHGISAAEAAEENFKTIFQKREIPEELMEIHLSKREWPVIDLLMEISEKSASPIFSSRSEARRLVQNGGVKFNGEKVMDVEQILTISEEGQVLQASKRHIWRIFG